MSKFVYVLSNESMPGLYKIGKTVNIQTRLKDLDSTPTPTPFTVEFLFQCEDNDYVEKSLHKIFNDLRVRNNREFFRVDLKSVEEVFKLFDGNLVSYEKIIKNNLKTHQKAPQIIMSIDEYKIKQQLGIQKAKLEGKYKGKAPVAEDKILLVKELVKNGLSQVEVARQLNVSRKTIYNYLNRL